MNSKVKNKKIQLTPWEIKEELLDKIPEVTQNIIKYKNSTKVSVCLQNQNGDRKRVDKVVNKSEMYIDYARKQFSFRQRLNSKRQQLILKPLSIQKYIQANKKLLFSIKQVQNLRVQIEKTHNDVIVLKLIESYLNSQKKSGQLSQIKDKFQCLFPLLYIGNHGQKRKMNRKSLNDILVNKY